jgi:cytidylate kinase
VRSERRLKQHAVREKARGAVAEELKERDRRDRTRQASPLEPAADAVVLDTTHLGLDEVLKRVFRLIEERR